MNIFSSMMSVEDMVTRTAGGEGCSSPGDYLRYSEDSIHFAYINHIFSWEEMEWNITGLVTTGGIDSMLEVIYPVAQGIKTDSMKDLLCGRLCL